MNNKLNFTRLIELSPVVYDTIINKMGQIIELCEHPISGDEAPVIAVCKELKLAEYTSFFDTEDLTQGSDYTPYFIDGNLKNEFEIF